MSLMRLSVKKAAHADMSRAAYRKSGAVLGPLSFAKKIKKSQAPTGAKRSGPAFSIHPNNTRVPHISLIFREMWDTANPSLGCLSAT